MEFEAYRLIQYATASAEGGLQTFGSLSNSLNYAAAHPSGDVFRKVALVRFDELYPALVNEVLSKGALGLVVILPSGAREQMSIAPKQLKVWEDIQQKMATESIAIPVYFAYETDKLFDLHAELKREAIARAGSTGPQRGFSRMFNSQAEYMMILNKNEPKQLSSVVLDVFYVRSSRVLIILIGPSILQAKPSPGLERPKSSDSSDCFLRRTSHLSRTFLRHGGWWLCSALTPADLQDLLWSAC